METLRRVVIVSSSFTVSLICFKGAVSLMNGTGWKLAFCCLLVAIGFGITSNAIRLVYDSLFE
jgi:hypothetical protein